MLSPWSQSHCVWPSSVLQQVQKRAPCYHNTLHLNSSAPSLRPSLHHALMKTQSTGCTEALFPLFLLCDSTLLHFTNTFITKFRSHICGLGQLHSTYHSLYLVKWWVRQEKHRIKILTNRAAASRLVIDSLFVISTVDCKTFQIHVFSG